MFKKNKSLPAAVGQASSASAEVTGKLAERMAELAWDFAVKEGFRVFKSIPVGKPGAGPTRGYRAWSGQQRPQRLTATPEHCAAGLSTSSKTSPPHPAKGHLVISPDGLRPPVQELYRHLQEFMKKHIYPLEQQLRDHQVSEDRWSPHPAMEQLKVPCLR